AVIEGEAEVREGAIEKTLHPGEHLSTSPTLDARPLTEAIAWSRNADRHLAILAVFAKGIATTAGALTPLNEAAPRQSDSGQRAGAAGPAFEEASVRLCDPNALPQTRAGHGPGDPAAFR